MVSRQPSRRLLVILSLLVICAISIFELLRVGRVQEVVVEVGDVSEDAKAGETDTIISVEDVLLQLDQPDPNIDIGTSDESADIADSIASVHVQDDDTAENVSPPPHRVLFSVSTKEREYMRVYLGETPGSNINIIPHPTKADFWIAVAQREQLGQLVASEQLVCTVGIQSDAVICAEATTAVPFAMTQADGDCRDNLAFVTMVIGARDSRMFYGPEIPYIMYGAKSNHICFGQWLQDARTALYQFNVQRYMSKSPFESAVELPRPSDTEMMEKNYFLFWDSNGEMYAHYTLWPKRAFSKLNPDGSGTEDLASLSRYHDQICMAKWMPSLKNRNLEAIHQATNSLSITTCKRSDPSCKADDTNTFIMHLFHHKTFYDFHAIYEPYIVLFRRSAPFEIHAIGQRPFWIHGRHNLTESSNSVWYIDQPQRIPKGHTEMFYITSMSWRSHNQKYHGYIDDVLFLSFGIEDTRPGVIDILAGDLLDDLAYC